ncbi:MULTISPECIES: preprotein translocase subunit YajC [Streptomyces]|uniref:preprotein translocase subunit YajC n=1 Tax=Streptomyces TaxID=1883 RepID=UPI00163B6CF4|nr:MULTISPECIES: preprotein translocase subunit YajC [Streptomyces]MBC2877037.1 preprotein translocase subunit YajC [Streptomyces sp. TYQ1024]UBI39887.1 preprotein translocase subunit YajC [Streptomyces mobaraensis]UKW32467.1 preprotein translocase subunit YajC [Streptomyces sp. TYQ1024]
MNIVTLLPFIVLIGAMFLMTRSAKNKQRQAAQMRDHMQPGTGVRTIGGMYATVKEVSEDSVLLEVAPGVHAIYAKNAIGAVLPDDEYNRIIHGIEGSDDDAPVVPDDLSSLTEGDEAAEKAGEKKIDLGKDTAGDAPAKADAAAEDKAVTAEKPADATKAEPKAEPKDGKRDGGSDAK